MAKNRNGSSSRSSQLARRRALVDAVAGTVGSLVSLWAFYPIEIMKTNLQAGSSLLRTERKSNNILDGSGDDSDEETVVNNNYNNRIKSYRWLMVLQELWHKGVLFQGLGMKTIHVTSSSFCYFYVYSYIFSWWTAMRIKNSNGSNERNNKQLSTGTHLALSAVAAMINVLMTMPFDVISTQHQTKRNEGQDAETEIGDRECKTEVPMSQGERSKGVEECGRTVEKDDEECSARKNMMKMEEVWREITREIRESDDGDTNNTEDEDFFTSTSTTGSTSSSLDDDDDDDDDDDYDDNGEEEKKNDDGQRRQYKSTQRKRQRQLLQHQNEQQLQIQQQQQQQQLNHYPQSKQEYETPSDSSDITTATTTTTTTITASSTTTPNKFSNFFSLWKGLTPALLLCSNPAINYTVFDIAKAYLLRNLKHNNHFSRITMTEAFLLGLISKFIATIATYPLIRVKVMLMVTGNGGKSSSSSSSRGHTMGMLQCLLDQYQKFGVLKGWYAGCNVQLIHTVLKSALLMMVRERITSTTQRLLLPKTGHTHKKKL